MEASSIPAAAAAPRARTRPSAGPLLRLRSDEQLVKLFRAGNEDAFRAIHDRYRARLFAYTRQMLAGSRQDAEDALQDVFVRAYGALRANDREVSLRAWLYRVAHNRCIDELRRPAPPPPETLERLQPPSSDPLAETEQKESLRRLVEDVRRLPEQQRSALLMREIVGMSYADLAAALDVTVPAVKSLLVRARLGLAQAAEARDTACAEIREELTDAHDRGVRASGLARRHLHDCAGCRAYRRELRTMRQRFAALAPTLGPFALLAKLLGLGGGGAAAGGTAASGGASAGAAGAGAAGAAGAAAGGAAVAGAGMAIGGGVSAGHVAAVVAAAVVGAGGAVEVQRTLGQDTPAKQPAADVRAVVPVAKQTAAAASVQATPARASGPAATRGRAPAAIAIRRAAGRLQARQTVAVVRAAARARAVVTPPVAAGTVDGNGNGGAAAPADPAMDLPPAEPPATTAPAAPATPSPASPGSGATTGDGPSTPSTGTGTATPPAASGTTGPSSGTSAAPATAAPSAPPSSAPASPSGNGNGNGNGGASVATNVAP